MPVDSTVGHGAIGKSAHGCLLVTLIGRTKTRQNIPLISRWKIADNLPPQLARPYAVCLFDRRLDHLPVHR